MEGERVKNAEGQEGYWNASGFDADFCKVIAVAVFGNEYNDKSVFYISLTTGDRFDAIEDREVDVLFRNTTWTVGRDLKYQITFGPPTFYDGQGFLIDDSSNIKKLEDMNNMTVCVQEGTTTIDNLNAEFRKRSIFPKEVRSKKQNGEPIKTNSDFISEFSLHHCDIATADKSQLATLRNDMKRGIILKDTISKEPLAPAYIAGDTIWTEVVNYSVYATIYASELDINQKNLSSWDKSNDLMVNQFLGNKDAQISENSEYMGDKLGIQRNFAKLIIEKIGNYDDIYIKNFKDLDSIVKDRGMNQIYSKGGILYSPPFSYPNK